MRRFSTALANMLAEIIIGVLWCAVMVGGAILLWLIAYGILNALVTR